MPGELTLQEVRERASDVRRELDQLFAKRAVVARPGSRQWKFFRSCVDALLGENVTAAPSRSNATQYKFEVERRLATYYERPGDPLSFVFRLADKATAVRSGDVDDTYPAVAGYVVLVHVARPEVERVAHPKEVREYLQRIVADAAEAELATYRRLPAVDLSPLDGLYVPNGPAYRRIENVVRRHALKQWTIAKPSYNPSTKRVLEARVLALRDDRATVRTKEYFYLRWWSLTKNDYVHVYNERNHQRYELVRMGDAWLVEDDIYPPPKGTAYARARK